MHVRSHSRGGHCLSLACVRTGGQSLGPSLGCAHCNRDPCSSPGPERGGTRQSRSFLGVAWWTSTHLLPVGDRDLTAGSWP